jgi:hypothetical protein
MPATAVVSIAGKSLVDVCDLPLIHDKTVDEWGTTVLDYLMTGPPAHESQIEPWLAIATRCLQAQKKPPEERERI